ncbi:MerC domain-containing protein [Robertkochia solimangrovi]|uniref:MerC domain-containing protein n=1 Tax=Robertkochia solimangrovi TaxID=2213046 RepID=UPI00117C23E2|nr:MerC domain-containing protein [Robertkochia solimangrovi]TRZ42855.1 hypothetical protein DMZ48_12360 [Robertkochia solimangrovi]
MSKNNTLDLIAMSSSLICAIHCAAVPIVFSFTSMTSLRFLHNPIIEWTFILIGIVFVVLSLWPGYRKVHKSSKPLLLVIAGFTMIALSRLHFSELWEMMNTVTGAVLVSIAHWVNWKLTRSVVRCNH